jgi:hypothetical protein
VQNSGEPFRVVAAFALPLLEPWADGVVEVAGAVAAFAVEDADGPGGEVDVARLEREHFADAEAGPVHELEDAAVAEPGRRARVRGGEQLRRFVARDRLREPPLAPLRADGSRTRAGQKCLHLRVRTVCREGGCETICSTHSQEKSY